MMKVGREDLLANIPLAIYATGFVFDWTYYMTIGWPAMDAEDIVSPILFGFVLSFFWPLQVLMEGWRWLLG